MKTGWDKYPWANYRAQDASGDMWYYENKPTQIEDYWYSQGTSVKDIEDNPNWRDTLETRPVPPIKVDEEVIVLIGSKWYAGITSSSEDKYFIDLYDDDLFSIPITPITTWRYINELEITL